MKIKYLKNLFLMSLTVFLLNACNQNVEQLNAKPEPSIKENSISKADTKPVIEKWLKLWETYDLKTLGEMFVKSDELTYFSSEKEGLIKGYDQLIPHHKGFGFVDGGKKPEKALWLEDIETRVYDGSAMVAGVWYFGDKKAPKETVQKGPVTFVLVRDKDGAVKIMHTHFANYPKKEK